MIGVVCNIACFEYLFEPTITPKVSRTEYQFGLQSVSSCQKRIPAGIKQPLDNTVCFWGGRCSLSSPWAFATRARNLFLIGGPICQETGEKLSAGRSLLAAWYRTSGDIPALSDPLSKVRSFAASFLQGQCENRCG